jgi:hypothetical protein
MKVCSLQFAVGSKNNKIPRSHAPAWECRPGSKMTSYAFPPGPANCQLFCCLYFAKKAQNRRVSPQGLYGTDEEKPLTHCSLGVTFLQQCNYFVFFCKKVLHEGDF